MAQTTEGRRASALLARLTKEQQKAVILAYSGAMEELTKVGVSVYGHAGDIVLEAIVRVVAESEKCR